mgnify:CR=1 FL=1
MPNETGVGRLMLEPCELAEAAEFIHLHHRHHEPPQGHRFSLKAIVDGRVVGIAVIWRPVGKGQQDGKTVEITRLCTDGTKNAVSFLVGACKRAARALGWKRMISYTLTSEYGAAWRASGMEQTGETAGGEWSGSYGPKDLLPGFEKRRKNTHPTEPKRRWEIQL